MERDLFDVLWELERLILAGRQETWPNLGMALVSILNSFY